MHERVGPGAIRKFTDSGTFPEAHFQPESALAGERRPMGWFTAVNLEENLARWR